MSGTQIPIYRLPIAARHRVGSIKVVKDRNGKIYVDGSRVEQTEVSGEFYILTLKDGRSYYVLARELEAVR